MINSSPAGQPMHCVTNFEALVSTPFHGATNAICWNRTLTGDFGEIAKKVELNENITVLEPEELCALQLSEQGQLARAIILHDLQLLTAHGAAPILNIIKCYDRDDAAPFFLYWRQCSALAGHWCLRVQAVYNRSMYCLFKKSGRFYQFYLCIIHPKPIWIRP
jgi:hypothetical protein